MTTDVDKMIEEAKNKSTQLQTQNPQTTAVANYQQPRELGLDDLGSGEGFSVDAFLKVSEEGLKIKDTNGLFDELLVDIDMSDNGLQIFNGARYGGNSPIYIKTFDMVNEIQGNLWASELEKAHASGTKVSVYKGADITMTCVEDVKNHKGEVVATAGSKIGHSTPPTGKANLTKLVKAIQAADLTDSVIRVKVTYEAKSNKDGNNWGVLNFELIGEAE